MKSYKQAVDKAELTQAATLENNLIELIAFAPDGKTWATVRGDVRFYEGDVVRATLPIGLHANAGSIEFSRDGKSLWVGLRELDTSTGQRITHPEMPDLAAWLTAAGHAAPPTLSINAAKRSADGALIVVNATGVTRDRKHGLQEPKGVDAEWLLGLDGVTRAPQAMMRSGYSEHSLIAISDRHVAAGGHAGLRVFARDALTTPIELDRQAAMNIAWSPDGALLAAGHKGRRAVSIWRAGAWDAPAASWEEPGTGIIQVLAFHPTRPVLLVGNGDKHVRLYGVADATLATPPLLLDLDVGGAVHGAAFSPDGKTLLVSVGFPLNEIRRYDVTLTP